MSGGAPNWSVEHRGDTLVVTPVGRVDEATASQFTDRLIEAVAGGGRVVIDLASIPYMSSRGLRALTLAHRKGTEAGATIVLARPSETMREILAISRYDQVFGVFETVEDALAEQP